MRKAYEIYSSQGQAQAILGLAKIQEKRIPQSNITKPVEEGIELVKERTNLLISGKAA